MEKFIAVAICILLGLGILLGIVFNDDSVLNTQKNVDVQVVEELNDSF